MKNYYIKHRKEFRIITIISFWIVQGIVINYFLGITNHGANSSETDAVIILEATAVLFLSICVMLLTSFYLENIRNWRLIFTASILIIPIIWLVLIISTGNPLYYYAH